MTTRDPLAEVVHATVLGETARERVTRLVLPTRTLLRKEPLGSGAQQRLRREVEILRRLAGAEGVLPLAADAPECPGSIMLVDVGGTLLSRLSTPVDPGRLVDLARSLARAVAAVHARGVVHRDINPANVVLSGQSMAYLVDFGRATTVPEVQVGFVHPDELVGAVPYLAPEQSGRTGRRVDERADLFAVGAVLYELATGRPPSGAGDPLQVMRDRLTTVPAAPSQVNPAVPAGLSAIIMHLLEKEPDDRYQSAAGVLHDLAVVSAGDQLRRPGERDVPARALAPSRLAGREREVGELGAAFVEAVGGHSRGILVSGPPGVGKTALVNELREIVAGSDGWFVAGKFDQFRRDQEYDGVRQALRALGRLLLAEPEDSLAEPRRRLLAALGPNAGLAAAVLPEVAELLRIPPSPGDPLTAQVRGPDAALEVLRVFASRKRPVVFFVDDLQWAGRTPLSIVDRVISTEEPVEGLVLVAAYREGDLDAAHPLTPVLARWQSEANAVHHLRLHDLTAQGQSALVAELLHLDERRAAALARSVAPAARGNPYDTIELLAALRHDGTLRPSDGGWAWDRQALRRRLRRADQASLLAAWVAALPRATQELLTVMAGLAGQVELDLLAAAGGLTAAEAERRLAPAVGAGLLVAERDVCPRVRFRHDRTQEALLRAVPSQARRDTLLRAARRLAGHERFSATAAEQYLLVADEVHDPAERRRMACLFRRAAEEALVVSNHALAERYLSAALDHVDPGDTGQVIAVRTGRHAALYSLGRLDEADDEYDALRRLGADPPRCTAATAVQVSSLTNQGRAADALRLGVGHLRRLGIPVPERDRLGAEVERGFDAVYRWAETTTAADDLRRPECTDRARADTVALLNRLMPPAFVHDPTMLAWLTLQALQMWIADGPDGALVGPAAHAPFATIACRGDYLMGHRLARRLLSVARRRGYEPGLWQAQFLYTAGCGHWFDPLEDNAAAACRALEGLVRGGDLQNACWTYYVLVYDLLDCAPTLRALADQVDEALAFATRTSNTGAAESFRCYRQLVGMLRGEAVPVPAGEDLAPGALAGYPLAAADLHATRALAAAIFDRPQALAEHTAALTRASGAVGPNYLLVHARFLRSLALADQARAATGDLRAPPLGALDQEIAWLAARAEQAGGNFLHLLHVVEAERAWAVGDFHAAACAFDVAQHEVEQVRRPWHRALILERAARFYLSHGMQSAGRALLAQCRRQYLDWGATAKVDQLDWAYAPLRADAAVAPPPGPDAARPTGHAHAATAGGVDLLGVIEASRALCAETTLRGVRTRALGILSAITGATHATLLLRDREARCWRVAGGDGVCLPLDGPGGRPRAPAWVVRYVERTREPVAVLDATRDDRFARDPYFAGMGRCSVLAVPVLSRGALRAMLVLENRVIHGAFSAERLDTVMIIAGQLAVALDNALVHASLEQKVAERTRQLADAIDRLEQLSATDPLTRLANRRRLDEILETQWRLAARDGSTLAFAMVDVDFFKHFNDQFGHTAGDRCLQLVATCIAAHTPGADLVARYGGEEFAVIMPGTDERGALELARDLCTSVRGLREPHPYTAPRVVTVSIGVAALVPGPGATAATLVELADRALYRAKRRGRNRVESAGAQAPAP